MRGKGFKFQVLLRRVFGNSKWFHALFWLKKKALNSTAVKKVTPFLFTAKTMKNYGKNL